MFILLIAVGAFILGGGTIATANILAEKPQKGF